MIISAGNFLVRLHRYKETEEQKIIQDKGLEHERSFLGVLSAQGRRVCDIEGVSRPGRLDSCGDEARRGDHL